MSVLVLNNKQMMNKGNLQKVVLYSIPVLLGFFIAYLGNYFIGFIVALGTLAIIYFTHTDSPEDIQDAAEKKLLEYSAREEYITIQKAYDLMRTAKADLYRVDTKKQIIQFFMHGKKYTLRIYKKRS